MKLLWWRHPAPQATTDYDEATAAKERAMRDLERVDGQWDEVHRLAKEARRVRRDRFTKGVEDLFAGDEP